MRKVPVKIQFDPTRIELIDEKVTKDELVKNRIKKVVRCREIGCCLKNGHQPGCNTKDIICLNCSECNVFHSVVKPLF